VALAGGGFTMAAAIYIFNLKKFEPLLRPAKLSAFLGYMMFVVGLFFDLGQPWRIWHPMVMWNPHSVLFEVSWCVMLYTTVLSIDLFIIGLERYGKQSWIKFFRDIYLVLVVAGIMLSTLHQSSLGALFLLLPQKMSNLWATGAVGPLFFVSAIIGGMSVVTLESLISARVYKRKPEMDILPDFSKGLGIALLVYFAMKVTDLYARGVTVWVLDKPHFFFFLELFGTVALPALLLVFKGVRNSEKGLAWAAGLAAFGVVLNRFNVSLTSYGGYREFSYFPSFIEIIITVSLIALGIVIFDLGRKYLPIYKSELGGEAH
jgi:Ni/Fe-hydrogenase subunit HybB-like protein